MSSIEDLYRVCIVLEQEDSGMNDVKEEIIKGKSFYEKIDSVEKKFDQYNLFFYKMIKVLASKGQFKEIYLKLSWNTYFTDLEEKKK